MGSNTERLEQQQHSVDGQHFMDNFMDSLVGSIRYHYGSGSSIFNSNTPTPAPPFSLFYKTECKLLLHTNIT
jgi:hypothetical protein